MRVASQNHDRREARAADHLWFETALVSGQWAANARISVSDGIITAIETDATPQAGDEKRGIGIPGITNLHSHAFQRGMAGFAEARGPGTDTFWTWREIMYHFLDRMTPEDMEAIAALAYVEMLESGFTRVGEFHYVHHDCRGRPYDNLAELAERICAAAQTTGINLTLLPSFYAHSGFGELNPTTGQRRFITSLGQFARLYASAVQAVRSLPGSTVGVAPHSLRAVSAEELREIITLSTEGPIHVHVAEQVKEVEECVAATGARPVAWLLDHASVNERWCLIHATHMLPDEIAAVARSGATVGLCPVTEANLGDGVFPAVSYLDQSGCIGIGTDSNVNIDAAGELRMLEYSQRLTHRGRNLLARGPNTSTGRSLFDLAFLGGNRASNVAVDGLAVGRPADMVALAVSGGSLAPRERGDAILDRFIFAGPAACAVEGVWVGGRCIVTAGRHVRHERIAAKFHQTLKRLLST